MNALRAILAAAAVIGGLFLLDGAGGNVAPARPWHYPCHEWRGDNGQIVGFTPVRLFWEGRCQQP